MTDFDPAKFDPVQKRLAQYSHALKFENLSPEAVHSAKQLIVDTLGVMVAGFGDEPCQRLRKLAAQTQGSDATVLCTRDRTSLEMAAFVNASTARYVEANDVFARYKPGTAHGHPSDVITPLLAVAESVNASGRDFITAVVLAYEIYLRICDACHSDGFDATTFGCISIAAAAGKLMGLSELQLAHAISMAAATHNITKQVRANHVSVWKALAAGQSGRDGIQSATLARAGFDGPSLPFHGAGGWCEFIAGKHFEMEDMGGGKVPFLICDSRIKTRPARALTISAILAAEKLHGKVGALDKVSRIVVTTYARAKRGTGPHHWVSDNRETADHSIPYCVAAALIDGPVTPSAFDEAHLRNPLLRQLMARVEVAEDDAFTAAYKALPQSHRSRVSVYDAAGRCVEAETGGDEDDLASAKSDAWIERKFRAMAEGSLGAEKATALLGTLWKIDSQKNLAPVIEGLLL